MILLRHTFFLVFLLFLYVAGNAQSEPQFTHYMYSRYLFNPACAGSEDVLEVSALHRSQYVGLTNRFIASQGLNVNIPIYAISSGIGVTVINDFIALQRTTYAALNYDYRKKFSWGKMGVGLGLGLVQSSINGAELRASEGDYSTGINHNDDILPVNLQQGIAPDLSFGIYFNTEKYFAGASINHIAFSSAKINATGANSRLNFSRNLFFTGGYEFKLSSKLHLMPSALIKSDLKKVQVDVAATFTIIDNVLTGISFRGYTRKTVDALALFLGFRYKGVQLVYSFDANLSYLTKFNTGSHEISLSYRYPLHKKESKGYFYYNPRYNM
ncbi:MAG: PorP/SprF family type IX secretion system membrane protein [Chitinophagales bacterium]